MQHAQIWEMTPSCKRTQKLGVSEINPFMIEAAGRTAIIEDIGLLCNAYFNGRKCDFFFYTSLCVPSWTDASPHSCKLDSGYKGRTRPRRHKR